jgi:hypothetical protein
MHSSTCGAIVSSPCGRAAKYSMAIEAWGPCSFPGYFTRGASTGGCLLNRP